jgi:hypothetical protein
MLCGLVGGVTVCNGPWLTNNMSSLYRRFAGAFTTGCFFFLGGGGLCVGVWRSTANYAMTKEKILFIPVSSVPEIMDFVWSHVLDSFNNEDNIFHCN